MRLLAISPHLDDAALGCGDLLAANPGAVVVTVMAGSPPPAPVTAWDRACGFGDGDDVVGHRRAEDAAALRALGATAEWLDFLDGQYAAPPPCERVAAALDAVVAARAWDCIASPLGIGHDDHRLVAAAAWQVARRSPDVRWLVYLDRLYDPAELELAVQRARDAGLALVPEDAPAPAAGPGKRAALDCYRSQRRAIPHWDDALLPERYWRLGARGLHLARKGGGA